MYLLTLLCRIRAMYLQWIRSWLIISIIQMLGIRWGANITADVLCAGRRKKNRMSGLLAAGLFSGGTLMAVGLSAIAALAGKALMTALLSLVLSGISAFRGSGDSGHKSTTYEIITKPVVTHAHTHSAEVQHEHGGGHHGYAAYARSIESNPNSPAGDSYLLAYRAQRPYPTVLTTTTSLRKPIEDKQE